MSQNDNPIDSRQLQAFVALAHGGSLKAAAAKMTLTESAISHVIRNLESNLNVKLFSRTGKGLTLTRTGEILLEEAVPLLMRMRDIRSRLTQSDGNKGEEIRLLVATSFIRSALHDVLMEFKYCFPNIKISVTACDRDACLEALHRGEGDAAIMLNLPEDDSSLKGVQLFTDELMLLMASDHRLTQHAEVPLNALCLETVYMRRQQNFTTRLIEQEIARRSFQLRNIQYISSFEAISEMVRLGAGVAFQTPWAFRGNIDNPHFAWRRIGGLTLPRPWAFAWPAERTMDARMTTLLRLCQNAGHRLSRMVPG